MNFKRTKIVYGYEIEEDRICAVSTYLPCDERDPDAEITLENLSGDVSDIKQTHYYSTEEWNALLYWVRSRGTNIEIRKAIDEVKG